MKRLYENLLAEQNEYEKRCKAYLDGALELDAFFPYASSMGIYRQKREGTWMVRPRILSGMLSVEQLRGICDIADRYGHGKLHLTIRQDIQFHQLTLEDTIPIALELKALGLFNKGAGGNSIRNIVCPATSGLDDEIFDVSPYAVMATRFALNLPGITQLPRKYKISFSNNGQDLGRALFADLGFVAKLGDDGDVLGFEVYGAGGLGNKPTTGILLEGFVEADEIFAHILAMKYLFEEHGDRTNRAKARIRFIRERIGDDAFRILYKEYVKKASAALGKEKALIELLERSKDMRDTPWGDDDSSIMERRHGYLDYIEWIPSDGDLDTEVLHRLFEWMKDNGRQERIEVRLTLDQGLLLRYVTPEEKAWLKESFGELVPKSPIEQSISCTGATNCRIGLCDSVALRKEVMALGRTYDTDVRQRLPRIYISGCRNSCGWHWIGSIGFFGTRLRREGESVEGYNVTINGKTGVHESRLGETIGTLEKDQIVDFLQAVFDDYLETSNMDFETYVANNEATIRGYMNEDNR